MPNTGDFDPAEAFRQLRAKEQGVQAQQDLFRANILKLLRYADEQLEEIRNPVVSEFVLTETWWTQESKRISDKRAPEDFKRTLRADQTIIGTPEKEGGFFRPRYTYTVATSHKHERQTSYYGSWLSLESTHFEGHSSYRRGLMKLRQPHAGYADLQLVGWDPRNVGHITIELTDSYGRERSYPRTPSGHSGYFCIHESLEETAVIPRDISYDHQIKQLTKFVKQALDFAATGQPPEPFYIPQGPSDWN